jgi:hypothetical protein
MRDVAPAGATAPVKMQIKTKKAAASAVAIVLVILLPNVISDQHCRCESRATRAAPASH